MHAMFREVLRFNRLKCACAYMQCDVSGRHAFVGKCIHHPLVKVQSCSGCRGCPRLFGKNRLVTLLVLSRIGVGDVRWQRHMSVLLHQRVGFVAKGKAKKLAVFIRPATQISCREFIAMRSHAQDRSHWRLFAHLHVRNHLVGCFTCNIGQNTLNQ